MAAKFPSQASTVTFSGVAIEVTHERVRTEDVLLDPNNPRIRLQIEHGGRKKPSNQTELLELIRRQPGYDDLQKQIRKAKGIYEPIIVRHNGIVAEGNTRLAVVKVLHEANKSDAAWLTIPVTRLPKNMSEAAVEMAMANFHIAGKNFWRPASQAEHIYRLYTLHGYTHEQIADETRMPAGKVKNYIEAFRYLIDEVLPEAQSNGGADPQTILESKFSHALEFIAGKNLLPLRSDPATRKNVSVLIATGKLTGMQVRALPALMKDKKTARILGNEGFKAAKEAQHRADPTADSKLIKAMNNLTSMLNTMSQDDISLVRDNAKAHKVFSELSSAVSSVADIVSPVVRKTDHGKK